MTLLKDARIISENQWKEDLPVNKETIELAIAYLNGEVSGVAVCKVLNLTRMTTPYFEIVKIIRTAQRNGKITIKINK